jgi:hypothetical protein
MTPQETYIRPDIVRKFSGHPEESVFGQHYFNPIYLSEITSSHVRVPPNSDEANILLSKVVEPVRTRSFSPGFEPIEFERP